MERRTVQLIDELVSHGFDNAAFQKLHHLGNATTIKAHREYAQRVEFQPDGTNVMVERRLEFVYKAYLATGFSASMQQQAWFALAAASTIAVPRE